ncbi:MAG: glutaredoxin family protein [Acidimicrobiia bacterium]|nr:glutaredoxin family protein [Acidimicrobiia bacterium]
MIFYTRSSCHLCESALPHAQQAAKLLRRRLQVVDIDSDDNLVVEFGLRVPVLTTSGGRVIAEGGFGMRDIVRGLLRR